MDKIKISKVWYELATGGTFSEGEDGVFFKFIAIWIAFNGLYAGIVPRNDKQSALAYVGREPVKQRHLMLLKNSDYKGAIDYLAKQKIVNLGEQGSRDAEITDGGECLKSLIEYIYIVRCNLFHGDKALGVERNRDLVTHSYFIMCNLLDDLNEPVSGSVKIKN